MQLPDANVIFPDNTPLADDTVSAGGINLSDDISDLMSDDFMSSLTLSGISDLAHPLITVIIINKNIIMFVRFMLTS
jgi:hypothetical protein